MAPAVAQLSTSSEDNVRARKCSGVVRALLSGCGGRTAAAQPAGQPQRAMGGRSRPPPLDTLASSPRRAVGAPGRGDAKASDAAVRPDTPSTVCSPVGGRRSSSHSLSSSETRWIGLGHPRAKSLLERLGGRDWDEEEDDDDSLVKSGEAKVDAFVKKLGWEQAGKSLMGLLEHCIATQRWEGKFAAAMAIRAAGEYVSGHPAALDAMAAWLVQLMQDDHYRVRYAAAFALGQMCHDQEKEFHARWHARLLPPLLKACGDPVHRVAAMAASAVEATIAELEEDVLEAYAQQCLQVFVACLNSSSHRALLVNVMQALGALAAGLEGGFAGYYDQLVEMLLAFVARTGSDPAALKLRGKAFECISLLGFSVGKEKFAPAAHRAMSAMLATPAASDGGQAECIREAMGRICEVLGPDFAPFLPALLPGILASVSLDSAVSMTGSEEDAEDDEIVIPTDGGFIKIKSGQAMEVLEVVGLLNTFIKETGEAFFDFVPPTVDALAKVLDCSNSVLNIASMVRDSVYPCWADLVGALAKAVPAKGEQAQQMIVTLVQRFVDKVGPGLVDAEDPEDIAPMSNGIASVVKNAGVGCLQPVQVQGICDLALAEILKSFQRDEALRVANAKACQGAPPQRLGADGDGSDDVRSDADEMEEQEARIGLTAILGACAKANPDVFMSYTLPKLQPLVSQWLASKSGSPGKLLGLHVACDCCEYLGARAVPLWPSFMDASLEALGSASADERQAAAFTLLLAAQEPAFGPQYAGRAYAALAASLQRFKAKKSDEDAQRAADNVVAALVELCLRHPGACPDPDGCWGAALARMPLKVDTEEGHKVHRKLFAEAQKQGGGALGSMSRVAQVLGYLCEIHGKSEYCDDELERDLGAALAGLPAGGLESLLPQFSQKQQKKVERILASARA
mmetsp:Transcript_105235/g.285782  ORF Transcript_105235/g.285782 Transcript_105235/m.285782 type:complete len:912 (+) Transcript_105235:69-2804(+)